MASIALSLAQPRIDRFAWTLEAAGHDVIRLPFQRLARDPLELSTLGSLDLTLFERIVFVSPSAVFESASVLPVGLSGVQAAAIGPGTVAALTETGLLAPSDGIVAPEQGVHDANQLMLLPQMQAARCKRMLVIRGHKGRESWLDTARGNGIAVTVAKIYSSQPCQPTSDQLARLLAFGGRRQPLSFVFGQQAAARELSDYLSAAGLLAWVQRQPALVPHQRIVGALQADGWRLVSKPDENQTLLAAALELGDARAG